MKSGKLGLDPGAPMPERREGEVLVRIDSAGICHTDLELMKGYMRFEGVPGHELVGTVEEDGGLELAGERVVSEINCACGMCEYCRGSLRGHCPSRTVIGISGRQGAFADFISVPRGNLHVLPDRLPERRAVFVEPFAAALKGVEDGDIRSGHRVAVIGDGNLGLLVTMAAARTGCGLLLVGKHPDKMKIAGDLGIGTHVLDAASGTRLRSRFDRVIDCTGSPGGLVLALELVKPRGRIVMKTTVAEKVSADLAPLVIDEVELVGSRCGDFGLAVRVLAEEDLPVEKLISGCYDLEDWKEAFARASQKDSLKVIFRMGRGGDRR